LRELEFGIAQELPIGGGKARLQWKFRIIGGDPPSFCLLPHVQRCVFLYLDQRKIRLTRP
jgi:hypothetical protein